MHQIKADASLRRHDRFIMHYAYGELDKLEEEMRKSFHGHLRKRIAVREKIGVMLPKIKFIKGSDCVINFNAMPN